MDLRTWGGREKLGQSESGMDIYTLPNVKQIASGKQHIAQGDQLGALRRPRGVG